MLPSSLGNLRTRTGLFTDRRHTHTHTEYTESTFIACEVKRRMKRKKDVLQRDEEVPTVIRQGLYLLLAAVRGGAAQRGAQEHEEQREHLRETTVQNRD